MQSTVTNWRTGDSSVVEEHITEARLDSVVGEAVLRMLSDGP
jgi:hypothetical protein